MGKVTDVLNQDNMRTYVEHLVRCGRKDHSSAAIGTTARTTIRWYNESSKKDQPDKYLIRDPLGVEPDEWFHDAVDAADNAWNEGPLMGALIEQATGYRKPVIYKGQVAYEPDTSDPKDYKVVDGVIVYPPKLDAAGNPVPLTVHEWHPAQTQFLASKRIKGLGDKREIDLTSGGKPIFFPLPSASVEDWIEEQGLEVVDVKKPAP